MGWSLDDIPWHSFEPDKVDPGLVDAVKAASLVEYNGTDYGTYLCGVFHDDPEFQAAAKNWAQEEIRHGLALARWAALADPGFKFEKSFRKFLDGYRLPLDADKSVRGSRSGELLARCVVEAGTSSFYSAVGDAADEPLLKEICRRIAADEFRHYKLFYDYLKRYRTIDRPSLARRLWVAFGRLAESEDDELAYAYHCGNDLPEPYNRGKCTTAYGRSVYRLYRRGHTRRGFRMVLKAAGIKPNGWLGQLIGRLAWRYVDFRRARLERAAA